MLSRYLKFPLIIFLVVPTKKTIKTAFLELIEQAVGSLYVLFPKQ